MSSRNCDFNYSKFSMSNFPFVLTFHLTKSMPRKRSFSQCFVRTTWPLLDTRRLLSLLLTIPSAHPVAIAVLTTAPLLWLVYLSHLPRVLGNSVTMTSFSSFPLQVPQNVHLIVSKIIVLCVYSGTLPYGHPWKAATYDYADISFGPECIYKCLCTIKPLKCGTLRIP